MLNVAKDFLFEKNYDSAARVFINVTRGLEMLAELWLDYYCPPWYANHFALGKIFAFGINDAELAKLALERAMHHRQKA